MVSHDDDSRFEISDERGALESSTHTIIQNDISPRQQDKNKNKAAHITHYTHHHDFTTTTTASSSQYLPAILLF